MSSKATLSVFLTLCCQQAFAQTQFEIYGVSASASGHVERLLDGSMWEPDPSVSFGQASSDADRYLRECNEARSIVGVPKTQYPARVRYDAVRTFSACVENARTSIIGLDASQAVSTDLALQPLLATLERAEEESAAEQQFMGLSFGVGIGASFSDEDRISAAEIGADGRIRATSTQTQEPRVILESHYYGWCKSEKCNAGERGIGPFFGIVARDDKLISAFALGAMFGWKSDVAGDSEGFSIGIGAMLDSDVSSLADGFEERQPLPMGETTISFESKSRWGSILFFTRTF